MDNNIEISIRSLPIWKDEIRIKTIDGGITNQNFLVQENSKKFFVRLGNDIPEHNVSRSNELIANKAAFEVGVSPAVVFNSKGVLILDYIEGITLSADGIKDRLESIIPLLKKIHYQIPKKLYGQSIIFWVFHVIKNYAIFLKDHNSSYTKLLPGLLSQADKLELKSQPYKIVFGHNDLIPANFLDDGNRLWIIDWEYAGFNSPLFDLGGLASNSNFSENNELYLLENYFEKKINKKLLLQYYSLKCASLLRETMWSMVSELTSEIDFNYAKYTQKNLTEFNDSYKKLSLK